MWVPTHEGGGKGALGIAGDPDAKPIQEKAGRYFGAIPSGRPVTRHEAWPARRTGSHRQIAHDRVPQARIYKLWNIPQFGATDIDYLNLVSDVLDMTRMDAGKVELIESEFDLGAVLTDEYRQLAPLADQKKIVFECLTPDPPIQVRTDSLKLPRVLTNPIGTPNQSPHHAKGTATRPAAGGCASGGHGPAGRGR